jgi:hypothetical protein
VIPASAVKSSSKPATPVTTASVTTASVTTAPGDCRGVRDDAKRANRNACRQNTYCSLLHGVFPQFRLLNSQGLQRSRADLPISNCCLRREFPDSETKLGINFRQSLRRNKRPPVRPRAAKLVCTWVNKPMVASASREKE